MKLKHRFVIFSLLFIALLPMAARPVYAGGENLQLIFSGLARTVFSVVKLPITILASSTRTFPLGLIGGVFKGTAEAVGGTLLGAFDTARGAAPYAKYAIFAI